MRYSTPVFFIESGDKQYDPDSGTWIKGNDIRAKKYANVTHMEVERQQVAFGDVRSDRYVVRLQRPYERAYDHIEIGGKKYVVDIERCPGNKRSMVVVEDGRN